MKSLALFNPKSGVGKTTLTFNLAHMAARLGWPTVLVDYDPQCDLSALILEEDDLAASWEAPLQVRHTVANYVAAAWADMAEYYEPELHEVADNLWLLPGDLLLGWFEQKLAEAWMERRGSDAERALSIMSILARVAERAANRVSADFVMLDVGPSLGALNRAVLLGCDAVVVPLAPDVFSLPSLKNVGNTIRPWREDWAKLTSDAPLPRHAMEPLGYIVQPDLARFGQGEGNHRWISEIPSVFRKSVLADAIGDEVGIGEDPYCIAHLKHFASLAPLAQLARKPFFDLKKADGIGGGQTQTVARAHSEFEALTRDLMTRIGLPPP